MMRWITAMPDRNAIYRRTWWLFAVGCIAPHPLLALLNDSPGTWVEGIVLGTIFAQSVLAAAWGAWGPGAVSERVPQSLLCAVVLGTSLAIGVLLLPGAIIDVAIFPLLTMTLWLIALVPFSGIAIFLDLQLRYQADDRGSEFKKPRQFKINQVLAFTALIAVLFAWLRLFIQCSAYGRIESDDFNFWFALMATQVVSNLPLICVSLLPQNRRNQMILALVLVGAITLLEYWYAGRLISGMGPPDYLGQVFLWSNLTSVVWVLVFTLLVRRCGYHLSRPCLTESNDLT